MSTSRTREKADGELFKSTGIDDNATSTAVTIDASENVGIGESAPAQRLEVNELSQTAFTGIRVNNPNGNVGSAGIEFQVDGNYSKAAIFQKRGHANGGGDLIFAVDSSTDAANWVEGDEKLRITKAGNVTVNNGNLVIGTNGKGIDFSANADSSATGASTTSELLDDYEEGTWTPSWSPTGGSWSGTGTGKYTKIGRQVTASFKWVASNQATGTKFNSVQGLPFTSLNETTTFAATCTMNGAGRSGHTLMPMLPANSTNVGLQMQPQGTGGWDEFTPAQTTANTQIHLTVTYMTP